MTVARDEVKHTHTVIATGCYTSHTVVTLLSQTVVTLLLRTLLRRMRRWSWQSSERRGQDHTLLLHCCYTVLPAKTSSHNGPAMGLLLANETLKLIIVMRETEVKHTHTHAHANTHTRTSHSCIAHTSHYYMYYWWCIITCNIAHNSHYYVHIATSRHLTCAIIAH
jgi:hypothetical protein